MRPEYADALHFLGLLAHQAGDSEAGIALVRRSVALAPGHAEFHSNLGTLYLDTGRLDEALAACRRALALKPDHADAWGNLGGALHESGRHEEAATACRRALELRPEHAQACNNLGNALRAMGRRDEAFELHLRAARLGPAIAEAHSNVGSRLRELGRMDEALAALHHALRLKPRLANAHNNLGFVLHECRRFSEAVAAYRQAVLCTPGHAEAHSNLGNALKDLGQLGEALAVCRHALRLNPASAPIRSNLLLNLHYAHGSDAGAVFDEHRRWDEAHARPLAAEIAPHTNARDPARRLRIGYVSPDFRAHPVAHFFEPLLAHHDRSQVEVCCYSCAPHEDAVTARLKNHDSRWCDITTMTDDEAAARIRADSVDILVDLAGHTAHNRLPIFARKPAPVQATWLGYCDTTGLRAMDWRITDAFADPPGTTEHLHTERLIRLPETAWCFRAPDGSPPVSAPPASRAGHIIFGCFNARAKLTDEHLQLWTRLLEAVPNSRLLLKTPVFEDPSARQIMSAALDAAGIVADRVAMLGFIPGAAAHLAAYERVDIALDTAPYCGTTTTCEALWMGVPVVTLAGSTHASRVGASLLSNLGHPELIAHTAGEYVHNAAHLAADLPRLASLRASLREKMREKMRASVLMDGRRFAGQIEHALRTMWQHWCARS